MSLAAERQLRRILEQQRFEGVFFFHGDAARTRDDAARSLVGAAVEPETRDFNLDAFRASEVDPEALAAALAMPPAMAARRVVALYGAERLSPTGCAVVESVLERTPPDLTFVVTATIPKGSRKAFYRRLKDAAVTLEWRDPPDGEVPGWLIQRAADRYGLELTVSAAEALADAVGADLGLLEAELEKLATVRTEGGLSVETIRKLVPNVRPVNRWSWLDLVAEREYGRALSQLPLLLSAPDSNAVGLLNAMVDQHVLVGIAVEGGSSLLGRSLSEVGKPYLKFKVPTYGKQAKRWSGSDVEAALRLMRRADARIKSTAGRDWAVLVELLLSLDVLKRGREAA